MDKLRGYLQLMRLYGIFIVMMPILGAISNGIFSGLSFLLIVGICANIFGFVQNDYFDIEIDKKSGYVADRPLASGLISKEEAIAFMALLFIASVLITLVFFSHLSFLFLMLYYLFYTLYNKLSKRFAWMEYFLGLAAMMIFFAGAFSYKTEISLPCILISFLPLLKYAFNVGISANLKDLKYDLLQEVKTTPAVFGAKADNGIYVPKSFILYGYSLKIVFIIIVFFVLYYFPAYISLLLVSVTSLFLIYTAYKVFENIEKRGEMLFYAEIHEILTYVMIASVLYDYVAIHYNVFLAFSLVIIPPLWIVFCLKIFFGGRPLE
jgi:4-hydroxybenzoate polyprenyltransferase